MRNIYQSDAAIERNLWEKYMMDAVKCEYKLPLPEKLGECEDLDWVEMEFKTTSFEGVMDEYEVTEDGQIYHWHIDREFKEVESHPMGGFFEEKHREMKKLDWTGELLIHGVHLSENYDYLFEFKLTFYKGELKDIERVLWKEEDPTDRKEMQKQVEDFFEKKQKAVEKWWYSLYIIWAFIIKFICSCARWISQLVNKITWKIERWLT